MVHQYISNGYHIVLDVNSGSVHVVDETAYRVIPLVEEALAQQMEDGPQIAAYVARRLAEEAGEAEDSAGLQETVEEVLELKEAGMLYTEDIYENYIGDFKNRQTVVGS